MARNSILGSGCSKDAERMSPLITTWEPELSFPDWSESLGDKIQNTEAERDHPKNIVNINKL